MRKFAKITLGATAGLVGIVVMSSACSGGNATPAAAPAPTSTVAPSTVAPVPSAAAVPVAAAPVQSPAPAESVAAESNVYTYEVVAEGKGTAMVTYSTEGMNIAQESSAKLPWRKDVEIEPMFGSYVPTQLSAQGSSGVKSITCRILHGGQVVTENTSTGQFAVVTCQGS
jgi:hypothetical protein